MAEAKILIVEDNIPLLEGIRELLEFSGYDVLAAENGREALSILDNDTPDLIVSDIMMPEMDGYEFHAAVRERPEFVEIPFIFLTAKGEKADVRRGKEIGADDYITKPFEDEDLLVAIQAKLARWSGLRKHQDEEIADLKHKILLSLSHEFRTPLTYIINYADMIEMEEDTASSEEFHEFMQGIRKGATRLNQLVEDFLVLVELETGEAVEAYIYRKRIFEDFSTWLRVTTRRYEPKAEEAGLSLIIDVPDGLPPIIADETYLADAIGRLLDNAIKFSTENSEHVRLSTDVRDAMLYIRIEDQGIGIEESKIDELFDVFHQIDRAKQEQQGTGSGLAICLGLVNIHGGSLQVESKLGKGSAFTIELPIAEED